MPLEKLIKGFKTFRASYFGAHNRYEDLLRKGQTPEALVIACSDSRNDPALVTQSEPGDIFVIRNVAAIVPPYHPDHHVRGTSAAIEFAVKGLKVKHIIVLGHARCGGVQALAQHAHHRAHEYEFLTQWVKIGSQALKTVETLLPDAPQEVRLQALEQAMILTSLNNLMTFPWIRDGVATGEIALHGWYFDMVHGQLMDYDFAHGTFKEIRHYSHGLHKQAGACCAPWPLDSLVKGFTAGKGR